MLAKLLTYYSLNYAGTLGAGLQLIQEGKTLVQMVATTLAS